MPGPRPPDRRRRGARGAILLALLAGGCGDSASVALPTVPAQGTAAPQATGPAVPAGYAGLGTRPAVFAGAHQESPRGRGPGVPLVSAVTVNSRGLVTGYDVQFNDRPALSDYERLASAAGLADLPRDRSTVTRAAGCLVYGSPSLKRLIGVAYTRVTTKPGTRTARVATGPTSGC